MINDMIIIGTITVLVQNLPIIIGVKNENSSISISIMFLLQKFSKLYVL